MENLTSSASIAQEIRLAVAPVFLLTGIAGLLAVLSGRLSRVTERARAVMALANSSDESSVTDPILDPTVLMRRIWLIQFAIRLSVLAALLICVVIVALFIGDYTKLDFSPLIASLFVIVMIMMVIALLFFLHEVGLATQQTRRELETSFNTDSR